jgi:Zn-dependent alcohol dehydrogenase
MALECGGRDLIGRACKGGCVKTRAAVLWDRNKDWSVEEIELDPPRAGEVLVSIAGSGLCHSDEHVVTGDLPTPVPIVGGHEGAGIVQEVGPGVTGLAPGDRVIFSFVPSCGSCRACASGMGGKSRTTPPATTPAARTSG